MDLPDARDGLTRKERIVLWVLSEAQRERAQGRRHGHAPSGEELNVPLPMLYGRVLDHVQMSMAELQAIVQRLVGR